MVLAWVLAGAMVAVGPQDAQREEVSSPPQPEVSAIVQAWLEAPSTHGREQAEQRLVGRGGSVVPELQRLIDERSPAMSLAFSVLCRVGEAARPALPALLAVLRDREFLDPEGTPPHVTARGALLQAARDARWASAELVPVLAAIAQDDAESDWSRSYAVLALGGMGPEALPVLAQLIGSSRKAELVRIWGLHALAKHEGADLATVESLLQPVTEDPGDELQGRAIAHLFEAREKADVRSKRDSYADLIERSPFDARVRGWLMRAEERNDPDRPEPLIQATKARWRARLAEGPDPVLAMQLAGVIEDQLHGNELGYCASRLYQPRERSGENHETLAQALRMAQSDPAAAPAEWGRATRGLAKLALLRGDWDGMNEELARLGQPPVPEDRRPWLAPPPKDWDDLAAKWQACDESLRSGDCAFEVRVEEGGAGFRGAHVLLREKPPQSYVRMSGVDVRTLFHDPSPIGWDSRTEHAGFGYEGDDRERCRYAVTGDDGIARFEQLPSIEIEIEVLIPTANFAETLSRWDLFVRQPDGSLELDHYRWNEGFKLESRRTVTGPHLVVRPHYALNLGDGEEVGSPEFELEWPAYAAHGASGEIRYEIELAVGFPPGSTLLPQADTLPRLATATVETTGTTWPLGSQGVGALRLVPGNLYLAQMAAKDARGELLARAGRTWFYVPWPDRPGVAPEFCDPAWEVDFDRFAPIEARLRHHGGFARPDGSTETLADRLDRWLRERPGTFESEYVRVAHAWSRWCDGDPGAAHAELEDVARALPSGNVAGDTARALLAQLDAGVTPGRELVYVVTEG